MTRYGSTEREFWRRMLIVYHHPDYRDLPPSEALQRLHEREWRAE